MKTAFYLYARPLTIALLISATLIMLSVGYAEQGSVAHNPISSQAVGVTAKGVVVKADGAHKPPWRGDQVKTVAPMYPYADRAQHHQGGGMFHLVVNPTSGFVTDVTVKKSTGYRTLDESVIRAFRQWQFKPGKWKAFDFPVGFYMTPKPLRSLPSGATQLPPAR
jgi:TonB family protein